MGKKMSEKRRAIIEEVKQADAERKARREGKPVIKPGTTVFRDKRRAESERAKKRAFEKICCVDKDRPLPTHFRRCVDCPGGANNSGGAPPEAGS